MITSFTRELRIADIVRYSRSRCIVRDIDTLVDDICVYIVELTNTKTGRQFHVVRKDIDTWTVLVPSPLRNSN